MRLQNLSASTKRFSFLFIAALPLTFIRNDLQYGWYIGDSAKIFIFTWIIHYAGLAFLAAISSVAIEAWHKPFFEVYEEFKIDMDAMVFIIACLTLFMSVIIFFLANWPESVDY